MSVSLLYFLFISCYIYIIGLLGMFLLKRNLIIILMCLELVFLAVNFNFIIFSVYLDDIIGQVFTLLVLTVAAGESAIGLAILVLYYRKRGVISINLLNYIKG